MPKETQIPIDISENDIDRERVAKFCAEELITAFRSLEFLSAILKKIWTICAFRLYKK